MRKNVLMVINSSFVIFLFSFSEGSKKAQLKIAKNDSPKTTRKICAAKISILGGLRIMRWL
jgi:hypothetical protein